MITQDMDYHPVVSKIIQILQTHKMQYVTFEHEPVRTSEEAAKVRPGFSLKQGAKAIILRTYTGNADHDFIMIVLPGDSRFNGSKLKKILHVRDIRFATPDEIAGITGGVEPGGVPPFGNIFNMRVVADSTLFDNEKIILNAGDRRFSVAMKSADYRYIIRPTVEDII